MTVYDRIPFGNGQFDVEANIASFGERGPVASEEQLLTFVTEKVNAILSLWRTAGITSLPALDKQRIDRWIDNCRYTAVVTYRNFGPIRSNASDRTMAVLITANLNGVATSISQWLNRMFSEFGHTALPTNTEKIGTDMSDNNCTRTVQYGTGTFAISAGIIPFCDQPVVDLEEMLDQAQARVFDLAAKLLRNGMKNPGYAIGNLEHRFECTVYNVSVTFEPGSQDQVNAEATSLVETAFSELTDSLKVWLTSRYDLYQFAQRFEVIMAAFALQVLIAQIEQFLRDAMIRLMGGDPVSRHTGGMIVTLTGLVNDRSRGSFDRLKRFRTGTFAQRTSLSRED